MIKSAKVNKSFSELEAYCRAEEYKGWDPYDGLNSRFFQSLPIKKWDLARLAWIQGFKRSPINFRPIFGVPKVYNAKGLGLLLTAYCNIYTRQEISNSVFLLPNEQVLIIINELAERLISLSASGYAGACWGYSFDWQARRLFFFPKNTPTVVATQFCATALMDAFEVTGKEKYLNIALSSGDFVLQNLQRTPAERGFLFSYSPINGNNTVYNASLLGSRLLSYCYGYNKLDEFAETARQSILACCDVQAEDGSWKYGGLEIQSWIDSFHTGYNLDAIQAYQNKTDDNSFNDNIDNGFHFYISSFFEASGKPKYYHNKTYPIDIHCPAQLLVTLNRLDKLGDNIALADRVLNWTIDNMQDKAGFFYYQLKKGVSSKISYMRWAQAFMLYAMSHYFITEKKE